MNSCISGIFFLSSSLAMWIGRPAGFITPGKSPSFAMTVTRRASRLRVSNPPTFCTRTKPRSSTWRT